MAADTRRTVVALVGGVLAVIVAGWYDAYVVPNLHSGPDPDLGGVIGSNTVAVGAGYVAVAASILILALLVRRAHRRSVDVVYAVGGAGMAVVGPLIWAPALDITGAPPVNALAILGLAMLLIGLGDMRGALWVRPRPSAAAGAAKGMPHVQS
ncbi:MAG TPA: hypothetical protein VID25_03925 [Candidatus Limnocylindrales bacterium]